MTTPKQHAVIVGSGIYGISTALWMLDSGRYDVTVLDKSEVLPASDAASTDLNKIIRCGDYAEPLLGQLAVEAVEMWKKPEWEGTYHESGVTCLTSPSAPHGLALMQSILPVLQHAGIDAVPLPSPSAVKERFSRDIPLGDMGGRMGYANPVGGWAEAGRALQVGIERVRALGGKVRGGCEVVGLRYGGVAGDGDGKKRVEGVELKGGEVVGGDVVLCCAGAWTPWLLSASSISARLPPQMQATGQSLATVQLTPTEMERYASVPVILNLDNHFYIFPPNPDGLVKMAIHGPGYLNLTPSSPTPGEKSVSVPRTRMTPGGEDGMIPLEMLRALRKGLGEYYPELAQKDFAWTRLCWYCESATGDWVIDYHPDFENLVIASGDCGHAYKFFPVLGREILRIVERDATSPFRQRFAFDNVQFSGADAKLLGEVKRLSDDLMARPQDLKA